MTRPDALPEDVREAIKDHRRMIATIIETSLEAAIKAYPRKAIDEVITRAACEDADAMLESALAAHVQAAVREAVGDTQLIEALAKYEVVVRPMMGGKWCFEDADGEWNGKGYPTWRDAARAGLEHFAPEEVSRA